jgi:HTH-type transcriptional regulator/antitoxin HigA
MKDDKTNAVNSALATGITSREQYDQLIALMDALVEDYDSNKALIDLLFPVLERYEDESEQFRAFNERIEALDAGVSMLKVIIDQNGLTQSDFPEIGGKSLILQILSGKRALTLTHIDLLSKRFGIPKYLFIEP